MAEGVVDEERTMVGSHPTARSPRHGPSPQQQNRARGSLRSRDVAVGQHQQQQRSCSCCSTRRRRCGKCNRTRATTATGSTMTRTRYCRRIAGIATSSSVCSSSALLLLSIVTLLSLSPSSCLGSDVSVPAATATAAVAVTAAAAAAAADSKSNSLWDTISGDPDYSKLTACLLMADPSVAELLRAIPSTAAAQPLTLFAPRDSAFEQPAWRGGKANDTIFEDR